MSRDDLLKRCERGDTQNNNESFNALIWRMAPKHLHAGLKIIEIATFLATCIFNEGYLSLLKVMNLLLIKIGPVALNFANDYNKNASYVKELQTQQARTARRNQMSSQNEFFEEVEGLLYNPGMGD